MDPLLDTLRRPLTDLRISVTDRCNLRCRYCMPCGDGTTPLTFVPRHELLSFEELARLVAIARRLGVRKVRITGGEPLLRRQLETLVARLAALPGLDLAMTTNGVLLADRAAGLARAGLRRVTVSLDALDDPTFAAMNGVGARVASVLAGIDAARTAGLAPVKVNAVIRRGVNEHAPLELVRHFRGSGVLVRFIEYMDVGGARGWRRDAVVPAREILAGIAGEFPLEPLAAAARSEVARRWRLRDGSAEIGVIASITEPFCRDCSRARITADGRLYTCLFAADGLDLRGALRDGGTDDEIAGLLAGTWRARADRYSELRSHAVTPLPRAAMSYLGG